MKKVKFKKSAVGIGYGYMAGAIVELSRKEYEKLEKLGYIEEYNPIPEKPVMDLPEDIPGRKKLIDSGITTIEDVKKIDDFTEIGFGKKLNENILNYVKGLE